MKEKSFRTQNSCSLRIILIGSQFYFKWGLPGEEAEYANWGWAPPWLCAPLTPENEEGSNSPAKPPTPNIPPLLSWGDAGLWYRKWTGNSTEVILRFSFKNKKIWYQDFIRWHVIRMVFWDFICLILPGYPDSETPLHERTPIRILEPQRRYELQIFH